MKNINRFGGVLLIIGGLVLGDATLAFQGGQGGGQGRGGGAPAQIPAGIHTMRGAGEAGMLADAKGMTLYTSSRDPAGVSNCYGECMKNWPPLLAAADAQPMTNWTIIKRTDGIRQWAYKGMALYMSSKDQKPGDTTADGVWKAAVP